ncbi:DUF2063 domain-containing protein [Methylolobus aquaticus]|nr:DUF2063 domain-containing protein [Methylolobus aquaticus]
MNTAPLPFQLFQRAFLASLRDPHRSRAPDGVPTGRWRVYRELLYNKIEASLAACFPNSRALLGPRAWTRLVKAFIAEHRCLGPCYREIPDEFMHYLQARGPGAADPPCLFELAHHEWMELVLMIAEAEAPAEIDPAGDLLANTPVLAPVLSLSCYRFPVRAIAPDRSGWSRWKKRAVEAETVPHFMLGFRNAEDEVRFTELSAVTAQLVQRLIDQDPAQAVTGREILWRLAVDSGPPDPERFVSYGAATLLELRAQGAIVGVRRSPNPSNETLRGT